MITSTRRFLSASAASVLFALTVFSPTLSAAPDDGPRAGKQERRLTIATPADAPVAIVAQRFAPGPNWLEGLSVDVLNASEKPVFYVALLVETVDLKVEGMPVIFMLTWGNPALATATELAKSTDQALRPGETVTVTIPRANYKAFAKYAAENGISAAPHCTMRTYMVGFGDGVGGWVAGNYFDRATVERAASQPKDDDTTNRVGCHNGFTVIVSQQCFCEPNSPKVGLDNNLGNQKIVQTACFYDDGGVIRSCVYNILVDCS